MTISDRIVYWSYVI